MANLSIRIDLTPAHRLGPGKVEMLEHIDTQGSIAGAGRAMNMSYRRAWELVAELNAAFGEPAVETKTGGKRGGRAQLTPRGHAIVANYRALEVAVRKAAARHLAAMLKQPGAPGRMASRVAKAQ